MRLWHKDLISYLPKKQLLGQWRECCAITKSIIEKGTPNHSLVNKIMNYSLDHFYTYCDIIINEMKNRKYNVRVKRFYDYIFSFSNDNIIISDNDLFKDWHNKRYLRQCYYNLQEKYDCGLISQKEWDKIYSKFGCD